MCMCGCGFKLDNLFYFWHYFDNDIGYNKRKMRICAYIKRLVMHRRYFSMHKHKGSRTDWGLSFRHIEVRAIDDSGIIVAGVLHFGAFFSWL